MTIVDEEMLTRLSEGDPAALQLLVEAYFPILCRFAEKFVPDSSLAKDIVQETFIKVWNNRPGFENIMSLKGYLFTLTRNGCLNLIRSRERQENKHMMAAAGHPLETSSVLTDIVRSEYIARIYQVVQTLSPKMQEVFYLSYEEGMTVRAIAEQLQMDVKAVKNYKYKTLVALRSKFKDSGEPLLVLLAFLMR
jgi:RNA polymerase sigma-70 factor (ECF subfamily)